MSAAIPAELRARFEDAGQGHVFKFVDEGKVTDSAKIAALVEQLSAIDVEFVNAVFRDTMAAAAAGVDAESKGFEPMRGIAKLTDTPFAQVAEWSTLGIEAVARGEVAALVLAGGQGTRLGFDKPKGEYNLGLPSGRLLFQLQADRVKRVRQLAATSSGKSITEISLPYVVMTSPMTHADTLAFFERHDYLGLGKENVMFFSQGTLPCMTEEGKIMLETGWHVAEAPDGNGGIYRAFHLSGVRDRLAARGVKYIHAFAVDNAICKVADPVWIGYCIANNADMGCKVCPKVGPEEAVGVLCVNGGQFAVIEYSDMSAATKAKRTETGELVFGAGNICIHFYSMDFLSTKCSLTGLPKEYHIARKKIPYADPETGLTLPKESIKSNTGLKLESFIFDVCPKSEHMAALEVNREHEFSPVKNAPGSDVDSPDTARALLSNLHASWLVNAGAMLEGSGLVEVSPLVSYGGEGLASVTGAVLERPCLLRAYAEASGETGPEINSFLRGPVTVPHNGSAINVYTVTH